MAQPEFYNFKFSAGKEFREKLERLAEVLGIVNAERHMPEIIERALDLALDKKDPKKKLERRRKREAAAAAARRETSPEKVSTEKVSTEKVSTEEKKRPEGTARREARATGSRAFQAPLGAQASRLHLPRYIPSSVREHLLERAGYRCEFRGPGGVRCTARTRLEVDHIDPVGKGGSCCEENLRVLCRGHNLLAAAREFGEEFMRGKIEGERARRAAVV